jgi:hypothetical protein
MNAPLDVLALAEARPLIGRIRGSRLRARKRTFWYRNSFQTYLSAELVADGSETRIRCRFGMHPFVIAFSVVWLCAATSLCGVALLHFGNSRQASPDAWPGIAVCLLLPAFGWGIVCFGRYLARGEKQFLTDFIRQTLNAMPTEQ